MVRVLWGSDLPPEPRVRIRKALESSVSKSVFDTIGQVENQKLQNDPELLVRLLGETTDKPTLTNIYKQLNVVTEQALGEDLQSWKEWLEKSGKKSTSPESATPNTEPPDKYAALSGPLQENAAVVADIMPLTISDGKIQIDRERWSKRYDGKSVSDLGDELRKYVEDRGLPADWLNLQEGSLDGIDYPQLIFPRFVSKSKQEEEKQMRMAMRDSRGFMYRYAAQQRNPEMQAKEFRAALEYDEGGSDMSAREMRNASGKQQVFILILADELSPENSLLFGSWPDGAVRLIATGSSSFVQIFQTPDGKCSMACAVVNKSLHRDFADANELVNDPHFKEHVADYLKQYGVQIGPSAK